jgi:uncharacterized protein (UPF0335 family)
MSEAHQTNITQSTFLAFIEELDNADQMVAEAVGNRKDVYKRAEGAGLKKKALIQARKVAEQSGDLRDEHDRDFRLYMLWLGKPIGYQSDWIDLSAGPLHPTARILPRSASTSSTRSSSPDALRARPGAIATPIRGRRAPLLYQTFDDAWLAGQEVLARKILPPRRRPRNAGGRWARATGPGA